MKLVLLFVGGTHDGERLSIDPFHQKSGNPVLLPVSEMDPQDDVTIAIERYVPRRIKGMNQEFQVYVHESLNPDEMLSMLIDGYRAGQQHMECRKRSHRVSSKLSDVRKIGSDSAYSWHGMLAGDYQGTWYGYVVQFDTPHGCFLANSEMGVRGTMPCTVTHRYPDEFVVQVNGDRKC